MVDPEDPLPSAMRSQRRRTSESRVGWFRINPV